MYSRVEEFGGSVLSLTECDVRGVAWALCKSGFEDLTMGNHSDVGKQSSHSAVPGNRAACREKFSTIPFSRKDSSLSYARKTAHCKELHLINGWYKGSIHFNFKFNIASTDIKNYSLNHHIKILLIIKPNLFHQIEMSWIFL